MKTIWKWTLKPEAENIIDMPEYAEILSVQMQHDATWHRDYPQLWACVDTEAPVCKRTINMYFTGHPMPDEPGQYIGTFQMNNGSLIIHVFEKETKDER